MVGLKRCGRAVVRGLLGCAIVILTGCVGSVPEQLMQSEGRFVACPKSPNCVSSDALQDSHYVSSFKLKAAPDAAWRVARNAVLNLPRTSLVRDSEGYLHAECQSALMGYVDDLQLQLRVDKGEIAVYSASRVGYSDFDVNRDRVEFIRAQLVQAKVISSH